MTIHFGTFDPRYGRIGRHGAALIVHGGLKYPRGDYRRENAEAILADCPELVHVDVNDLCSCVAGECVCTRDYTPTPEEERNDPMRTPDPKAARAAMIAHTHAEPDHTIQTTTSRTDADIDVDRMDGDELDAYAERAHAVMRTDASSEPEHTIRFDADGVAPGHGGARTRFDARGVGSGHHTQVAGGGLGATLRELPGYTERVVRGKDGFIRIEMELPEVL